MQHNTTHLTNVLMSEIGFFVYDPRKREIIMKELKAGADHFSTEIHADEAHAAIEKALETSDTWEPDVYLKGMRLGLAVRLYVQQNTIIGEIEISEDFPIHLITPPEERVTS